MDLHLEPETNIYYAITKFNKLSNELENTSKNIITDSNSSKKYMGQTTNLYMELDSILKEMKSKIDSTTGQLSNAEEYIIKIREHLKTIAEYKIKSSDLIKKINITMNNSFKKIKEIFRNLNLYFEEEKEKKKDIEKRQKIDFNNIKEQLKKYESLNKILNKEVIKSQSTRDSNEITDNYNIEPTLNKMDDIIKYINEQNDLYKNNINSFQSSNLNSLCKKDSEEAFEAYEIQNLKNIKIIEDLSLKKDKYKSKLLAVSELFNGIKSDLEFLYDLNINKSTNLKILELKKKITAIENVLVTNNKHDRNLSCGELRKDCINIEYLINVINTLLEKEELSSYNENLLRQVAEELERTNTFILKKNY